MSMSVAPCRVVSMLVLPALGLAGALVALPATPALSTTDHVVTTRAEHAAVTPTPGQSRQARLDSPAGHVAASWQGHPGAHLKLAFSTDGERFGPWVDAGRDEPGKAPHDGLTWGALHDAGDAKVVKVRTDRPVGRVRLVAISDVGTASTSPVRTPAAAAEAATTQPPVLSRAVWGADERLMTWAPQFHATRKLVVHHTASSSSYADTAEAAQQVRAIYRYHAVERGWGDIGYNFLIDRFGTIYEGRYSRDYAGANPSGDDAQGRGVTAAHAGGWNSGSVGVAMLGTHTDADITPAARDALTRLLAWEASRHGIDPEATQEFLNPVSGARITTPTIAGHRDYGATACPGDSFYRTLPQLRRDVAAQIGGPAPDTTAPSTPGGLRATGYRDRVELTWGDSYDDTGVTSYVVQRKRGKGSWLRLAELASTSYVDRAVARRTTYRYRLRAKDAAGNVSPWSSVAGTRTS